MLLLASGLASRFGSILEHGEKSLLPLSDGTPAIIRSIRLLNQLLDNKIKNIYVVVRPDNKDLFKNTFKMYRNICNCNVKFVVNKNYRDTNNSFSLYLGLKEIVNDQKFLDLIIMNADIVVIAIRESKKVEMSVPETSSGIISSKGEADYMRAYLDKEGYIRYIGFDIPSHLNFVNFLGLFVPGEQVVNFYNEYKKVGLNLNFICWYENILNIMISSSLLKIRAWPLFDRVYWDEIDDLNDYIRLYIKDLYLNAMKNKVG